MLYFVWGVFDIVYHLCHSQNILADIRHNYWHLPFVPSESSLKVVWCCVPCCQDVTVLEGCQRCQGDSSCTIERLNSLLNIPWYQWQASTLEYALDGLGTHLRGNPEEVKQGSVLAGVFRTLCHFFVLSVCTDFLSEVWDTVFAPTKMECLKISGKNYIQTLK